nr:integrase, catalytic region, zinc finger, CCHC-type, peptidase aspartic, catalytic [Tanacetum cinerariifolium]
MAVAVQQSSVDKQYLEIAKKELLLENDRLLQQIMSQDVLLTTMNSISLIDDTVNTDGNRKESCNLEVELLKSQNAFNDLWKSHSQLEKDCISLECSIQLNQEIFQKHEFCDNQNALEIPQFFENNNLKAQLQDKDSTICKLKDIIKSLREKSKEENVNYDYREIETKNVKLENSVAKIRIFKLDLEPLAPRLLQNREIHLEYLKNTQEEADILQEIVKQAKAKQPLDNALDFALRKRLLSPPKTRSKKLGLLNLSHPQATLNRSKPTGNKKNDRISQTPSRNMKKKVEAQHRNVNKKYRVVEPIRNVDVKQSQLNKNYELICATCCPNCSLVSGLWMFKTHDSEPLLAHELCKIKKSSHQPKTEDTNQEKLYLLHMDLCGPIRVVSINEKRYILVIVDDYLIFIWVRFLRSKDEAPKAIIKCIKNIQVHLNATVRNVRTDNETKFVNQTLREFYENIGISHQTSVARTPQQNGVVERQNQTLVEAARTMLIFSKAPLFLWAEAINTACYTQNRSLIRLRYNKTPYELMQDKKPDLSFFHVFGALCYPTNNNDELGLVSNPVSQQPCIPPNRDDWDHLFQPMFDKYFNPLTIVVSLVQEAAALRALDLVDSPVSTSRDQYDPSTKTPHEDSTSQGSSQEQEHSLIISQGFEESPKTLLFHDDPLNESPHEDSPSQGSSSNVLQIHTPLKHLGRWTKDHPIANVIGDPSRFISIRKQLKLDAMWCYFEAFLNFVKPKNLNKL